MRDRGREGGGEEGWGEPPIVDLMERLEMSEGGGGAMVKGWGHARVRAGESLGAAPARLVGLAPTVPGIKELGYPTINLQRHLDRYFPSRLQQFDLVPLTKYTRLDFTTRQETNLLVGGEIV